MNKFVTQNNKLYEILDSNIIIKCLRQDKIQGFVFLDIYHNDDLVAELKPTGLEPISSRYAINFDKQDRFRILKRVIQ